MNFCFEENGLHLNLMIEKVLSDKMAELMAQDPQRWRDHTTALMKEADRQLEEAKKKR